MSDDLLARATRALRESAEDEAAPPPVLETRNRVLATLRTKRASRAVWLRRVLPIAAVLVTSSAWAAANGHLGGTMRQVAAWVGLADEAAPGAAPTDQAPAPTAPVSVAQAAAAPTSAPTRPGDVSEELVAAPEPPTDEGRVDAAPTDAVRPDNKGAAVAAPSHAASARAAPRASASSRAVASAPPRSEASSDDPGQALYAAAHRKHFGERDYGGALAAWESYLRAAPGGRFAAEAHYNRAICLVRLGRAGEARAALQAFADGGYGGYRQSEAKALIEALQHP